MYLQIAGRLKSDLKNEGGILKKIIEFVTHTKLRSPIRKNKWIVIEIWHKDGTNKKYDNKVNGNVVAIIRTMEKINKIYPKL